MALNATAVNCAINSFADGTQKLSNEPGILGAPAPETLPALGGQMRYSLLLDPSCDIVTGDEVQIASMGTYRVDPRQGFYVQSVYPTAPPPYDAWHVTIIDKLQR